MSTAADNPRSMTEKIAAIAAKDPLFVNERGEACVQILDDSGRHIETIRSQEYKHYLLRRLYEAGYGCSKAMVSRFTQVFGETIKASCAVRPVYTRIGQDPETHDLLIDCSTRDNRVLRVAAQGCTSEVNTNVLFRRARYAKPLPEPADPDLSLLWRYGDVCMADRRKVVTFLEAAWCPDVEKCAGGRYPILLIETPEGRESSVFGGVLKQLVDPNEFHVVRLDHGASRAAERFVGLAEQEWLQVLDLWDWKQAPKYLADGLLTLSRTRPSVVCAPKGVLPCVRGPNVLRIKVGGAPEFVGSGPNWGWQKPAIEASERDMPAIVGGLIQRISRRMNIRRQRRGGFDALADARVFRRLGEPCEPPLCRTLNRFMAGRAQWSGRCSELLAGIDLVAYPFEYRDRRWPATPRALRAALDRMVPELATYDIGLEHGSRSSKGRTLTLTRLSS